MADVMSHGGDGTGDPLHHLPRRLDSACEFAPSFKQRGISRGLNLGRFTVPSCCPSWTEVLEEQRAQLRSVIETIGHPTSIGLSVPHLAANCYRDYILKAHKHLKKHRPSRPYGQLAAEDWQKCIDFFTSPTFVERSTKNKVNRGKAKYPSEQESKSFSTTRYDDVHKDPETQQWLDIIKSFKDFSHPSGW
ncbi:hypothetical protein Adt_06609 [Abeliophyllum distichum]|uniref:Uncharacterized protein n=1 Tax=Abeliophyllum distichum TaxID=126358 RepID=A0ABD1V8S4_9LAMI